MLGEDVMKRNAFLFLTWSCFGAAAMTAVMVGQNPAPTPGAAAAATPAAPRQGPGVQAGQDARYRDFVNAQCKTPPQPRGGGAGGGAPRAGGQPGAGGAAAGAGG